MKSLNEIAKTGKFDQNKIQIYHVENIKNDWPDKMGNDCRKNTSHKSEHNFA